MSVAPEQVEAHAAQGYSLADVARLLGVPFFSDKDERSREAVDAFNVGAARWREAGQPSPARVTDIICQAVHSQLLSKEMTRPELKEVLGFRYDDLNLAIETLEGQFLIDHAEDARGTTYYRASGMSSGVTKAPKVEIVPVSSVATGNGHGEVRSAPSWPCVDCREARSLGVERRCKPCEEAKAKNSLKVPSDIPCIDCGGPKSVGSGQRCKSCYDVKVAKNQEEKVSARAPGKPDSRQGPTYKDLDLQQVEDLMATEETMADAAKKLGMTTSQLSVRRQKDEAVAAAVDRGRRRYYDSLGDEEPEGKGEPQCNVCEDAIPTFEGTCIDCMTKDQQSRMTNLVSGKPDLCGCGRDAKHVGRCSARRQKAEEIRKNIAQSLAAQTRNIIPEISGLSESANKISAEPTIEEGNQMLARQTVSAEVYGGVRMHQEVQVRVEEMANWPAERITEFFDALAKVVEIPQRPIAPRKIKPAWSVAFEEQDPEGTAGLSMLYLVSMMHDGMEEYEKDAVWTLIKYLKRIEAATEAAKLESSH